MSKDNQMESFSNSKYIGQLAQEGLICAYLDFGSNTIVAWDQDVTFHIYTLHVGSHGTLSVEFDSSFKLKESPSSFGDACEQAIRLASALNS